MSFFRFLRAWDAYMRAREEKYGESIIIQTFSCKPRVIPSADRKTVTIIFMLRRDTLRAVPAPNERLHKEPGPVARMTLSATAARLFLRFSLCRARLDTRNRGKNARAWYTLISLMTSWVLLETWALVARVLIPGVMFLWEVFQIYHFTQQNNVIIPDYMQAVIDKYVIMS